jgi:4-amino-4-deoxy-L-arabinose transferase-like glycosyltransferase
MERQTYSLSWAQLRRDLRDPELWFFCVLGLMVVLST